MYVTFFLDNRILYGIAVNPLRAIKIDSNSSQVTDFSSLIGPVSSQGVEYGVSAVDYRRSVTYFIAYNNSGTYMCGFNFSSVAAVQPIRLNTTSTQVFALHYDGTNDTLVALGDAEIVRVSAGIPYTRMGSSLLPSNTYPVQGGVTAYDRATQTVFFVATDSAVTTTYIVGVKATTGAVLLNATISSVDVISMQFDDKT